MRHTGAAPGRHTVSFRSIELLEVIERFVIKKRCRAVLEVFVAIAFNFILDTFSLFIVL